MPLASASARAAAIMRAQREIGAAERHLRAEAQRGDAGEQPARVGPARRGCGLAGGGSTRRPARSGNGASARDAPAAARCIICDQVAWRSRRWRSAHASAAWPAPARGRCRNATGRESSRPPAEDMQRQRSNMPDWAAPARIRRRKWGDGGMMNHRDRGSPSGALSRWPLGLVGDCRGDARRGEPGGERRFRTMPKRRGS